MHHASKGEAPSLVHTGYIVRCVAVLSALLPRWRRSACGPARRRHALSVNPASAAEEPHFSLDAAPSRVVLFPRQPIYSGVASDR